MLCLLCFFPGTDFTTSSIFCPSCANLTLRKNDDCCVVGKQGGAIADFAAINCSDSKVYSSVDLWAFTLPKRALPVLTVTVLLV